eukprot:CAMPEP_0196218804 /NCGR_PEP_ID=MMETSP0912-20130531/37346_1 /TAXON_ID=49265 /ORGANISM="Thalassiosira rotula, Strain GSO102" /LENGTH=59 /DNA_ID=CAMNT_0041496573 /DNA_START=62 /DNA_END=238 /DNA_ORIENTATION=+
MIVQWITDTPFPPKAPTGQLRPVRRIQADLQSKASVPSQNTAHSSIVTTSPYYLCRDQL